MNFIFLVLFVIFFSKYSSASFLDLFDDNIRDIARISHSNKNLRIVNRKLALLCSDEFSSLELIFKNEKYEEILENPSSYFPLKVKSRYDGSSDCRFNKDHFEMLLKAQPNLYLLKVCAEKLSSKDIAGLFRLSNLKNLYIGCSKINSLSFLENNTNLLSLEIRSMRSYESHNTDALKKLTNLTKLSLVGRIEDINGLSDMIYLREVNLSGNSIKDLEPLSKAQGLHSLYLGNQYTIKDVSALADLTKLQILYLNNTKIEDISSLRKLQNLKKLSLSNTKIKTLAPLAYFQNLEVLDLSDLRHLKSTESKVLEKLTSLRNLDVDRTEIDNFFFLWNMKNFEELTIDEDGGGRGLYEFEKANPSVKVRVRKHDYEGGY